MRWNPSRTIGLTEAVRESGKLRDVMEALVAAQSLSDMQEAEAEHLPVEQEEQCDEDEEILEECSSVFLTVPRDATPATSEEERSEHEK